ncbi:MAG: DUF5615 family PIN-like protein [Gemmataceae bacterium]
MLRLASDADVHGAIIKGLRRLPSIDLVRAQDVLPLGKETPDPEVLEWAAAENRVLITNDKSTMIEFATQRVAAGLPMPGIIITARPDRQSIGDAIEDIVLIAECRSAEEMRTLVREFLPLKK